MATPIGYILGDRGEVFLETLYPQKDPMEPSDLSGKGLILYSLTKVPRPQRFVVPNVVPVPSRRPVRLLTQREALSIPASVYYGAATVASIGAVYAFVNSSAAAVVAQNYIAPVINTLASTLLEVELA